MFEVGIREKGILFVQLTIHIHHASLLFIFNVRYYVLSFPSTATIVFLKF